MTFFTKNQNPKKFFFFFFFFWCGRGVGGMRVGAGVNEFFLQRIQI